MSRPGLRRLAYVLAIVLFWPGRMPTAEELPSEQSVRAAMVFNFLKFIELPPDSPARTGNLRVCVAVRDARQADALATLAGRKAGGRELSVVDFAGQSGDCQVLYVDSRSRWNALADHPALRQALTISAYPGFARDGGMIEITPHNEGLRFEINLAEGRRAGFRFSPQLLRLAHRVHE